MSHHAMHTYAKLKAGMPFAKPTALWSQPQDAWAALCSLPSSFSTHGGAGFPLSLSWLA